MIIKDKNISLKAKGVYLTIKCMLEENMEVSVKDIMLYCNEKERLVRNAINELIDSGYVSRKRIREGGFLRGVEYKIEK